MIKSNIYLLSRLLNHDFPLAYRQIVTRLEKEEFTVDDVKQSFAIMQEHNRELDLMRNQRTKHPLSEKVAKLRDLRHKSLISLKGRITYAFKSGIPEEHSAATRLKFWLDAYDKDYKKKSIVGQSQVVYSMKHDISIDIELKNALEVLNLSNLMAHITSLSAELNLCSKKRMEDDFAFKKKNKQLREEAYKAIRVFMTTLELAIYLGKGNEEDHQKCIEIVDTVLAEFKTQYAARATRLKNKAFKHEEAQQQKNTSFNKVDVLDNAQEESKSEISEVSMSGNKSKFDLKPQIAKVLPKAMVSKQSLKDDDTFDENNGLKEARTTQASNDNKYTTITPNYKKTIPKRSLNKRVLSKTALHKKLRYSASSNANAKSKSVRSGY